MLSHLGIIKIALSCREDWTERNLHFVLADHLILLQTICVFPWSGWSQIVSSYALAGMTTWHVAADITPVQTWATLELEASCMHWSFFFCTLAAWMLQGDRQLTLLKVIPCCLCFLPSELWVRSLGIARSWKKWKSLYQLLFNWKLTWSFDSSRPCFFVDSLSVLLLHGSNSLKVLKNSFWLLVLLVNCPFLQCLCNQVFYPLLLHRPVLFAN